MFLFSLSFVAISLAPYSALFLFGYCVTNYYIVLPVPYIYGACKILDLLGYGSFLASSSAAKDAITSAYLGKASVQDSDNPLVYRVSQTVNLLPLLAYQKVYYDFFSESQWEKHLAYAYNVDYWDGKSQVTLSPEMLQLRYANYPKDYFMGMLPNSQYGSVAVLPSINSAHESSSVDRKSVV